MTLNEVPAVVWLPFFYTALGNPGIQGIFPCSSQAVAPTGSPESQLSLVFPALGTSPSLWF